jgi:hypothetical protein
MRRTTGEQVVDHLRREPERRLVEHQELGLAHEGASHREHLLLAARQGSGELREALRELRKKVERTLQARAALAPRQQVAAELQVLAHRHVREELAALGHLHQAARHDRRRPRRQRRAVEPDLPAARDESRQRLHERGLAGAVRTDHDRDLAPRRLDLDRLEHAHRAVARAQPAHGKRRAQAASAPRYASITAASRATSRGSPSAIFVPW